MNRDALLASLIGFGIGLLITGVLLIGPNLIKGFPKIHLPTIALSLPKNSPSVSPTPTVKSSSFAIASPASDTVVSSADLTVTGTARPGATVVVAGPNDEDVVVIKDDGQFSVTTTLSEGKNDMLVTEYLNGKASQKSLTVYFTKENWQ